MAHKSSVFLLCLMSLQASLFAREFEGPEDSRDVLSASVDEVSESRVLSLQHLLSLRRAIPPRLLHILDWKEYAGSGRIHRRGILFTYRSLHARSVFLAGDFSGWNRLPMQRNPNGVFFTMIPLRELEEGRRVDLYRYRFNVDGIWTRDPTTPQVQEDGSGGMISVFHLEEPEEDRQAGPRILPREGHSDLRLIEFAVHESALRSNARKDRMENVSLVGDFNNWNPESDLLRRGSDGVYRLRMRLLPGKYLYRIVVDGRWILDPFNETVRYQSRLKESYSVLDVR